ncbi:hypothetical protein ACFY2J_14620 [Streptomyces collinus]|uniref:hypothetical protein n=1 Tax=Streptomyces collinus TaxID=42684 RepID=UPI0036A75E7A
MHGVDVAAVEAVVDQPLRLLRPPLLALPPLAFSPLLLGDQPVDQSGLPRTLDQAADRG